MVVPRARKADSGMKVHFSIDDVLKSFLWLQDNGAASIFEAETFAFAKWLHDSYGLSTTCNCFYAEGERSLDEVSDQWRAEFEANADWLKFVFHGWEDASRYYDTDYKVAYEECAMTHSQLQRICGKNALADWTRTHYFSGSAEAVRAWKDCGIKGILTADDDRISCDLTEEELPRLIGVYTRPADGMRFLQTDIRLERLNMDKLQEVLAQLTDHVVIFTHEKYIHDAVIQEKLDLILKSYEVVEQLHL